MARISWNAVGQRFYETGVDRGVLYPMSQAGVAWPGLISVVEAPSGGGSKSYYLDGVMYMQIPTNEEFEATINAYYKPDAFAQCDGSVQAFAGLQVTQQPRKPFGLCYRTKLGNDVTADAGYKLHLVYNALAAPSQRSNTSIGSSVTPAAYSWKITTRPPAVPGYKRTAHLVIDSTQAPPTALSTLEDILYGTPAASPRLPLPAEVFSIFETGFGIIVTDNGDGTFTVEGPDDAVFMLDATTFQFNSPSVIFLDDDTYEISSI